MLKKNFPILWLISMLLATGIYCKSKPQVNDESFVSTEVDLTKQNLKLYWKDSSQQLFRSIGHLKAWLDSNDQVLVFAMNAGMFKPDYTPQGLFIQDQNQITPLDTLSGNGNFYLKPNGVFYTTLNNIAVVCKTEDFKNNSNIKYATQSGPMLVIDGALHTAFKEGSTNRHIRNGVGVLPNGHVLFAMSKKEMNLYDFANYFKTKGCKQALYLDGFVSRTYLPAKHWIQTDGDFSVIIGITTSKK